MADLVTLLGIAPTRDAAALTEAMQIAGPKLVVCQQDGLTAFAQASAGGRADLRTRRKPVLLKALYAVQRRMELACQTAAFLAADPAPMAFPAMALAGMLAKAAPTLTGALDRHGGTQQWDVTIAWPAEAVVAAQRAAIASAAGEGVPLAEAVAGALRSEQAERAAALHRALAGHVVAVAQPAASGVSETEAMLTVQVPRNGAAAIETALGTLPATVTAHATASLRGPLPAFSFASCRVTCCDPMQVQRAWELLGLAEAADAASLARCWRAAAFALHPDRQEQGASASRLSEAGAAYRLLREMWPDPGDGLRGLAELTAGAGFRLVVTETEGAAPGPSTAPAQVLAGVA